MKEYRKEIDKKDFILSKIGKGTDFQTSQGTIVHEDGITISQLSKDCNIVGIYDWQEMVSKIEHIDKYIETKPFFNHHIILPNKPIEPNTMVIEIFYGLTDKGDEFYRDGKWSYQKARKRKHWNEQWAFYNKRAVLITGIATILVSIGSVIYNMYEGNRIEKQEYKVQNLLDSIKNIKASTASPRTR